MYRLFTTLSLAAALAVSVFFCLWPSRVASAASVPVCAPGTLQQYIDLGKNGCLLDDKLFSGFSYVPEPPTSPTANQILLTPIATAFNPGFAFTANPPWGPPDSAIGFTVSVQSGGISIKDASLALLDFGASTLVGELLCLGGTFNADATVCTSGPPTLLSVRSAVPPLPVKPSDSTNFASVTTIDVRTFLTGKPLTTLVEQFSEVPEPSSLQLFGFGLVGIARLAWTHRKEKATNQR